MPTNNAINANATGITGFTGATFVGTPVTEHQVQIGGATSSALAGVGNGTNGQVFQANTAAAPTFSTATYPNTATVSQILYGSATNVISGLTTANNGTFVTSSTGVPSVLVGPGTSGNILQSNAAAAPSFSTSAYPSASGSDGTILRSDGTNNVYTIATYPASTTVSQVLFSSATNVISGLTTANNGVLIASNTGVPSMLAAGTTGQVLTATTNSPPSWAAATGGGVAGANPSTNRAIATWDGVVGAALFNNASVTISSAGEMVNTLQPAFLAYLESTVLNQTGNGTNFTLGSVTALTEIFDQNSDFNTNGTFTSPVTGKYYLTASVLGQQATTAMNILFTISTSNGAYPLNNIACFAGNNAVTVSVLADMDAADISTAVITFGAGSLVVDIYGASGDRRTNFSGFLAC